MHPGPIIDIAGSYFPPWIPSLIVGVFAGVLCYALLVKLNLARWISMPGLFYLLFGLLAGITFWLLVFSGQGPGSLLP